MMVATKGRYALRVMVDVALHGEEGYVSISAIAKRQMISVKYLEIIVSLLVNGKFLVSMRGKNGGYQLSRPASEIQVKEVIECAEGSIQVVNCPECSGMEHCPIVDKCLTLPLWQGLDSAVNQYLEGITLEKLIEQKV